MRFIVLLCIIFAASTNKGISAPKALSLDEEIAAEQADNKSMNGVDTEGPDQNMNYTNFYENIEIENLPKEVQPYALGTRGYRPNMLAVSVSDRTPGFGVMMEYSWNRIGAGISTSFRKEGSTNQFFYNSYVLYRWIPFTVSPYFLMGIEGASKTEQAFAGMAGGGIESALYQGITLLLGYTYHDTLRKGFWGGALGWAF